MSTEEFANLPRHVAIIMDGNGRWAKKRFLPRYAGHPAGVESVRQAVQLCTDLGIEVLTLFAFSSENWRRPEQEVSLLMELFIKVLDQEAEKLHRRNVRLKIIGDRRAFSSKLQDYITRSETLTQNNTGLQLIIAANYGGRWDIVQATQQLATQVQKGLLNPQDITAEHLNQMTSLANVPEPDLFIRTGGEQRISNFLLWQLAYTEFYFTDTLWPDFKRDAFKQALLSFSSRQRRFGQTGEQVEKSEKNK
ncbi:MAG: hypothetical protein RIT27_1695 [Pseudomonadota bacterium]|jgi:undecaprenyl diphosphate synthase